MYRSSVLACSALLCWISFLGGLGVLGGCMVLEFPIMEMFPVDFCFVVVVDWVSVCFCLVVSWISFFVLIFATSYMASEKNLSRFVWLVMFFVMSMSALVFSPSVLAFILGWDGLGLTSFLLVLFYQNSKALGAGLVTAIMNRVGDVFLLVSIGLVSSSGHWGLINQTLGAVVFSLVIVAMTKSAQLPFSYWLPAAMNAPTPVSALVHSSTLVTAGVYVLIRVLWGGSSIGGGSTVLLWVALVTMNMAGLSACFETDFKKVIALSTLSQLSVMMLSISLGNYLLAFFHLMSHAIFKALMFVAVGQVIHGNFDSQEFRSISGLWCNMPLVSGCLVLAMTSLMGLPFLSGFYSKDLVVELYLSGELNGVILGLVFVGMISTALYSLRVVGCCVMGKPAASLLVAEGQTLWDAVPLVGLSVGAIGGGFFMQSLVELEDIFVLDGLKLTLAFLTGVGGLMSASYLWSWKIFPLVKGMVQGAGEMWFFGAVSNGGVVLGRWGGAQSVSCVDLGWNEHVYGGGGVFFLIIWLNKLAMGRPGSLWGYMFWGFVSTVVLMLINVDHVVCACTWEG